MKDDQHRGLKRWERARQLAGLEADPDLISPLAWCKIHPIQALNKTDRALTEITEPEKTRVYIVRVFAKDLVCVHASTESPSAGIPWACWLVRNGINWMDYLAEIVRHYVRGLEVPEPFRSKKKLAKILIAKLEMLPSRDLPPIFQKMRETGILPFLPILDRGNCPTALPWGNLRACFQDFLEVNVFEGKDLEGLDSPKI